MSNIYKLYIYIYIYIYITIIYIFDLQTFYLRYKYRDKKLCSQIYQILMRAHMRYARARMCTYSVGVCAHVIYIYIYIYIYYTYTTPKGVVCV